MIVDSRSIPVLVYLDQYKAVTPARKLMKECAANLSKVYGVTKVDGSPDGDRLQVVRTRCGESEERMEDESTMDATNEQADEADEAGRGIGGFAAGVVFG